MLNHATNHTQTRCTPLKKSIYISLIIIIFAIVGCKKQLDFKEVKKYCDGMITKTEPIAIIDFSKKDSSLISDIEKQIKIDLCKDGNITGQTLIDGNEINFPAHIVKNCDKFNKIDGILEIKMNKENEVMVNDEFVSSGKDIFSKVLKITKEMMKKVGRKQILYAIYWDDKSNPDDVRTRIFQTLKAVKIYSDSLSTEKYNKKTDYLTRKELEELNKRFSIKIVFSDYFEPPPKPRK